MNQLRRITGIIWLALGAAAGYFSITSIGLPKFTSGLKGNQSDMVFGIIVLIILTPIIVGSLLTFGYYALKGEYDRTEG
ncbi:MAG: hypothetical protein KA319_00785 [Ferruginibacter sp.]|nr:hypothetical protein [Ferruginibacter sp.]